MCYIQRISGFQYDKKSEYSTQMHITPLYSYVQMNFAIKINS